MTDEFNRAQRKFYETDTVTVFNELQQAEIDRVQQTASMLIAYGQKVWDYFYIYFFPLSP